MSTLEKGPRPASSPVHEHPTLANMTTSLFQNGRITTTLPKAKRLRLLAERLTTSARRGDLYFRRRVVHVIHNKSVACIPFTQTAEQMEQRKGGYTYIVKIVPRVGNIVSAVVIEPVTEPVVKKVVAKEAEAVIRVAEKEILAAKAEVTEAAEAVEAPVEGTAATEVEAPIEETVDVEKTE